MTINFLLHNIHNVKTHRGRPENPRTSELGLYIKTQRDKLDLSIRDLAIKAHVSYKTLAKLELGKTMPRNAPSFLQSVAVALELDANKLLIRASLTPLLRPVIGQAEKPQLRKDIRFFITEEERLKIEEYLQYLRHVEYIESVALRANTEYQASHNIE